MSCHIYRSSSMMRQSSPPSLVSLSSNVHIQFKICLIKRFTFFLCDEKAVIIDSAISLNKTEL